MATYNKTDVTTSFQRTLQKYIGVSPAKQDLEIVKAMTNRRLTYDAMVEQKKTIARLERKVKSLQDEKDKHLLEPPAATLTIKLDSIRAERLLACMSNLSIGDSNQLAAAKFLNTLQQPDENGVHFSTNLCKWFRTYVEDGLILPEELHLTNSRGERFKPVHPNLRRT